MYTNTGQKEYHNHKINIVITGQKALESLLFFIVCLKELKEPQGVFRKIIWHSLPAELATFECVVPMCQLTFY